MPTTLSSLPATRPRSRPHIQVSLDPKQIIHFTNTSSKSTLYLPISKTDGILPFPCSWGFSFPTRFLGFQSSKQEIKWLLLFCDFMSTPLDSACFDCISILYRCERKRRENIHQQTTIQGVKTTFQLPVATVFTNKLLFESEKQLCSFREHCNKTWMY